MNPQVKALLLCAVGVILFALVMIPGGSLWFTIRSFFFGMFGLCAILVPAIFIYMGIMTSKEKVMEHKGTKIALSLAVLVFTCTLVYVLGATDYNRDHGYFAACGAAFKGSYEYRSMCGLIGAIFGYPFKAWFTTVPSVIICIVVLLVSVMILARVTLLDVARVAKKGYRRHVEPHIRRTRPRPQQIEEDDTAAAYQLPEVSQVPETSWMPRQSRSASPRIKPAIRSLTAPSRRIPRP